MKLFLFSCIASITLLSITALVLSSNILGKPSFELNFQEIKVVSNNTNKPMRLYSLKSKPLDIFLKPNSFFLFDYAGSQGEWLYVKRNNRTYSIHKY